MGIVVNPSLLLPSTYLGQVATRSFGPNAFTSGSKSINFASYHIARDDISMLAVEDGNWYAQSGSPYEIDAAATPTYSRYIQYPIGSPWQRFSYGGANSYTFASGETKLSNILQLSTAMRSGAMFRLGVHAESANGVPLYNFANQNFQTAGNNNPAITNQIWDASGTLGGRADLFATNSALPTTSGSVQNSIMPTAIVSYTRNPSGLIVSNSRGYGTQDYSAANFVDGIGDTGHIARALGKRMGYINVSTAGDTLANWLTTHAHRAAQAQYCSHIIGFDLINDVNGLATAATLATRLTNFLAISEFAGKKKFLVTTYPNPDATNTVPNANDTGRNGINGMIRSGQIVGADGFFDIDARVSSALYSGLYATINGQPASADFLHLNYYGNVYAASAVDTTLISR